MADLGRYVAAGSLTCGSQGFERSIVQQIAPQTNQSPCCHLDVWAWQPSKRQVLPDIMVLIVTDIVTLKRPLGALVQGICLISVGLDGAVRED
jgi:hypothetical protein